MNVYQLSFQPPPPPPPPPSSWSAVSLFLLLRRHCDLAQRSVSTKMDIAAVKAAYQQFASIELGQRSSHSMKSLDENVKFTWLIAQRHYGARIVLSQHRLGRGGGAAGPPPPPPPPIHMKCRPLGPIATPPPPPPRSAPHALSRTRTQTRI